MRVEDTPLVGVKLIHPNVHGDARGFFQETWQQQRFADAGIPATFVQDNHSRSKQGILRGLHYQLKRPQGKLVRVVAGEVFDVAVDLRRSSPTFGQWFGARLSDQNHTMMWVPEGFAHGFFVMSASADFLYKCTDYYDPDDEHCIAWDDADIGIVWPDMTPEQPALSGKDRDARKFAQAETYP